MERKKYGNNVIIVVFKDPFNAEAFGSLKAVFDRYSEDEIGCTLSMLYAEKVEHGEVLETEKCYIVKREVQRAAQGTNKYALKKNPLLSQQ